jgi:4-amino-4-deoxy-L-arabinose transferase-like glycosyltransferase
MIQNPYAQPPAFDTHAPVAARTSVAAILALVCALVCFVPGLGVLAVILGIAALFMISSSQGRVTGKGLAISGILIGLLVTFAWGIFAVGITSAMGMFGKQFMVPMSNLFQAVEKQDYATARTLMNTPSGTPAATDEQFDAFVTAYQAEVGNFQSMPTGFFEFIGSFQKVQGFFQPSPGQPQMPIPTEFSNGTAVVLLEFPQGTNPGSSPNPSALPIVNIGVASAAGNRIWLLPKATTGTPGTPAPAPSTPPATPDPTPAGDGEAAPGGSGGDADAGDGTNG